MTVDRFLSSSNMKEVTMAAIAHALSRAFQSAGEFDVLKQVALFCAAGLLVTLLCLSYGLDLSPGFF
jgi:ribose/xylose/arabinose/galactoside ABC-type transport system permease subunit